MMNAKRRLGAAVSMLLGCAGVLGLLYYMNALSKPPEPDKKALAKDFKVEKQKKKKKQNQRKKPNKQKRVVKTTRTAPAPNISTPMSGLSFDLPQFEGADLVGTNELLAGAGANKKLVMTKDSVDSLPKPTRRVSPAYPAKAQQRGIEGHVVLKIKVSERGDVETVRVVDASPVGVFEDVAIAAVRSWQFEPARYKGKPVSISVSQKIPFRLGSHS